MAHPKFLNALLAVLAAATGASAHLDSLLTPKPGVAYLAGGAMTIRWTIGNNHNGIDVHLSTDDKTWKTLVADLAKTQTAWSWTVPGDLRTDRARIRVCQKSGPAGCTDADSLSNPSDGPLYTLVSGRFRIEAASTTLATTLRASPSGAVRIARAAGGLRIVFPQAESPMSIDLRGREIFFRQSP